MRLVQTEEGFDLYKEKSRIGRCALRLTPAGAEIDALWIDPAWRRRGYGSYLLRQVLHRCGAFDRERKSLVAAPRPLDAGEEAFWARFGFLPEAGRLVRRHTPDLSAVRLAQDFLRAHLTAPRLLIDATCGNGGDTAFLCRLAGPEGRVLAFDIQPAALASTQARLRREGLDDGRCRLILDSHARLPRYVRPGSADGVMFNFGWLPGASHDVHSEAGTSIPALAAALEALRPGGVLSAVLYSGAVIGDGEKQAVLAWLEALPLTAYTVLVCRFANWADTAPLPCFVIKKP